MNKVVIIGSCGFTEEQSLRKSLREVVRSALTRELWVLVENSGGIPISELGFILQLERHKIEYQ